MTDDNDDFRLDLDFSDDSGAGESKPIAIEKAVGTPGLDSGAPSEVVGEKDKEEEATPVPSTNPSYATELELLFSDNYQFTAEVGDDDDDDDDESDFQEILDYKAMLAKSQKNIDDLGPEYAVKEIDDKAVLDDLGTPEELIFKLSQVGYRCAPYLAAQVALAANTKSELVRSVLLEGPPGCGKSYLAKSIARITGAEFMTLSCYPGMDFQMLIEAPSSMALANAIRAQGSDDKDFEALSLGVISRAFKLSQTKPVVMLIDEIDKVHVGIDTFFLGPLQDAAIHLESGEVIEANRDNLLIFFTKNYDRQINDALLRRVQPISLKFLDKDQEIDILSDYCVPELIANLVRIAEVIRNSDGAYQFGRPPAPEELLRIGKYIARLLSWDIVNYAFVGRAIWQLIAKAEEDRTVLELMMRYHPDFHDTLYPNGRQLHIDQVHAKLGREVLKGIVTDPEDVKRRQAYKVKQAGLINVGTPENLIKNLSEVKYECMPFVATQVSLMLNTPTEKVRAMLLEGPPGCGKSFLAKCLAKITGADFMVLSCYSGMNLQHLIEAPSEVAMAQAMAGKDVNAKADLMNLGIISRAFLKSQNQPVVLLVDEIDKVDIAIDTFFLGPLQDATIYLESRPPIDANIDNLMIFLTKNFVRDLNDALLRRVHPIKMGYLNSELERKILSGFCSPKLVENIISVVDRMRYSGGTYGFDRPPAPEELTTIANYINKLLEWGERDPLAIGRNIWAMISKSEHDRAVLEHMMRFHPDYIDPTVTDGRNLTKDQVYEKFGKVILDGIL